VRRIQGGLQITAVRGDRRAVFDQDAGRTDVGVVRKPTAVRGLAGAWEEARHLVDVAAGHAKGVVMLAGCVLVWALKRAVHLAVGVVEKLDLPYSVLVRDMLLCAAGYLLDSLLRELQVFVKIHEL
jgi:hypothetical protein